MLLASPREDTFNISVCLLLFSASRLFGFGDVFDKPMSPQVDTCLITIKSAGAEEYVQHPLWLATARQRLLLDLKVG